MKIKINDPEPTDPWNEPRILISVNNKHIILTNGEHSEACFTGTVISPNGNIHAKIGEYSIGWNKEMYVPFKGKIKLSN